MSRGVVSLVGAGAVGPAIVGLLRDAGWTVGRVASRREESVRSTLDYLGAGTAASSNADAARGADLLVLGVPDRAIPEVASEIAVGGEVRPCLLALHLSGALTSEALGPLADAGASVGSLHPLQSFADTAAAAERMAGTFVFFEGDDPDRIRRVAEDLGARAVPISREGKVLYHAGAAAACNLGAAMVDLGVRLFGAAGIEQEDALEALMPLLQGTLANLGEVGLPAALTGPVARGDVPTICSHLERIAAGAPDLLAPYAAASLHAIRIGVEKGTLSAEAAEELARLLTPDKNLGPPEGGR